MAYFVYILLSKKDKNLYVGCTRDIEARIVRHQTGLIPATKNRRPLEFIHYETFEDKTEAFNRERFLKSFWGAREKRKILKIYLDKVSPMN